MQSYNTTSRKEVIMRLTTVFASLFAMSMALNTLPAPAHADQLYDITKRGTLKAGIFEDFPPFSSAGPDMSMQGYDVDIANALAKALGVKLDLVGITGQNRIPTLLEHKVDILLSVGYSDERAKVIDFTAPYAPYYIAVLGPSNVTVKGPADLKGKSIAVNKGTLEDTSVTKAAPPGTDIQRYDDYNGVFSAFLAGQVQLMAVGNDVSATILARHPAVEPHEKFQLLSSPDHIGLDKNEPRFKQKLDETIAAMKQDGSLNAIAVKWLHVPLPAGF
jgi:polar amino acid transport system substrate-binding protein